MGGEMGGWTKGKVVFLKAGKWICVPTMTNHELQHLPNWVRWLGVGHVTWDGIIFQQPQFANLAKTTRNLTNLYTIRINFQPDATWCPQI